MFLYIDKIIFIYTFVYIHIHIVSYAYILSHKHSCGALSEELPTSCPRTVCTLVRRTCIQNMCIHVYMYWYTYIYYICTSLHTHTYIWICTQIHTHLWRAVWRIGDQWSAYGMCFGAQKGLVRTSGLLIDGTWLIHMGLGLLLHMGHNTFTWAMTYGTWLILHEWAVDWWDMTHSHGTWLLFHMGHNTFTWAMTYGTWLILHEWAVDSWNVTHSYGWWNFRVSIWDMTHSAWAVSWHGTEHDMGWLRLVGAFKL